MALILTGNAKGSEEIPRNTLYRPRIISLELITGLFAPPKIKKAVKSRPAFTTSSGLKIPSGLATLLKLTRPQPLNKKVELTEVASVRFNTIGGVSVAMGAIAPVLQPWYFQPITIEITGKSYMGAFKNTSLSISVDDDVKRLMEMRTFVNMAFNSAFSTISGLQTLLTIGEPEKGDIGTNQKFTGFISELQIEEDEENPYMQKYIIKYIGDLADLVNLRKGAEAVNVEWKKRIKEADTSSIKNTKPKAKPQGNTLPSVGETTRPKMASDIPMAVSGDANNFTPSTTSPSRGTAPTRVTTTYVPAAPENPTYVGGDPGAKSPA